MPLKNDREYRSFCLIKRAREDEEEKSYLVEGYASTFEEYTLMEDAERIYRERIDPDAFNETDMSDVVFLLDHTGRVYARTKNDTVKLSVDEHGLYTQTDLSKTSASRAVYEDIEAGNYSQMSFAFTGSDSEWLESKEDGKTVYTRIIKGIKKLYDISVVGFPANPTTDIGVATREAFNGAIERLQAERLEEERAKNEEARKRLDMKLNGGINMNIEEMTIEMIEARMAEIKTLVETNDSESDFEALSAEVDQLETRKAFLAEEQRKADIKAVVTDETAPESIEMPKEVRHMADVKEIRASEAYMNAYAEYLKSEDDKECRALLSELATDGQVPVPTIVEDYIETAWNEDDILSLVKKTYLKGIVRVGFELSATGAVVHAEGTAAPAEETLTLGIVELKPQSIKKWITISDEALDLKGEAFLRYIYDELTHQISKKAVDDLVNLIKAAPATSTATAVAVPAITADPALGVVASALSELSDRANNPVVIINKKSLGALKAIQYAANYPVDVFEGLNVKFNDQLAAIGSAASGDAYMIVGDLGVGAQANFPNGDDISIKYDDLTLAESDLVKVVGREYVALGLVVPNAIAVVKKA